MKKYIVCSLCFWILCSSCNDWLDVKPQGQTEEEDMYTTYEGFKDALTGCYVKLKDRDLYGEGLTMSHIESLAQLWDLSGSTRDADLALARYEYENTYAKSVISGIYGGLYNVIVQANSVLRHLEHGGDCIEDSVAFRVLQGEAFAIRAFCHLDVLRLFGQMPQNPVRKVTLPYSEDVSFKNLPRYYDYAAFCGKLESDLLAAENALSVDPVISTSLTYSGQEDDFLDFRGLRLNYYAVKALQARFYLYTGQTKKAYEAAKAVYTVMPVSLSSMADFNLQYYAAPSECLFALSNHKLIDYSIGVTGVGSDRLTGTNLFISAEMRDKLYEGQDITTHAGYANSWNTSIPDANGNYNYACVKKYYYDAGQEYGANVLLMKLQIVPVLRMSEVYLILLETTTDLEEANRLYADYMAARNVNVSAYFTDLASVKNFVLEEIRRGFYAEGHLFYAYKRQGIRKMLWGAAEVGEAEYILPLPDSEYDPGTGK